MDDGASRKSDPLHMAGRIPDQSLSERIYLTEIAMCSFLLKGEGIKIVVSIEVKHERSICRIEGEIPPERPRRSEAFQIHHHFRLAALRSNSKDARIAFDGKEIDESAISRPGVPIRCHPGSEHPGSLRHEIKDFQPERVVRLGLDKAPIRRPAWSEEPLRSGKCSNMMGGEVEDVYDAWKMATTIRRTRESDSPSIW